jgi:hypothetical protein
MLGTVFQLLTHSFITLSFVACDLVRLVHCEFELGQNLVFFRVWIPCLDGAMSLCFARIKSAFEMNTIQRTDVTL